MGFKLGAAAVERSKFLDRSHNRDSNFAVVFLGTIW
jgi:hypothetical protein